MVEVDVSRIELVAEHAALVSFVRLNRYLAFAPISSKPDAPSTVGTLAEALRADLEKVGLSGARVLTLPDARCRVSRRSGTRRDRSPPPSSSMATSTCSG